MNTATTPGAKSSNPPARWQTSPPLRYRGYYYDTETGLYYVSSRYYDPEIGRFINADGYTDTDTGFLGYNMFAYCNNCPTINIDPTGEGIASFLLITFGIALLLGGCSSDESDYPYYMNCYAYAMGWDKNPNTGKQFDVLPSPGILADQPLTEAEMGLRGEEAEGLYSSRIRADCAAAGYYFNEVSTANHTPKPGNWLIAVAYSTGVNDFHMYRKGSEGWTHMSAMSGVTRLDHEQNVIIDPKACNRGLHNVFVGYYEVGPNRG